MRILDIDLDFFLDEIAHFRKRNNQRLDKRRYVPWNSGQVECFLEKSLGLNKSNPIPGYLFTHHDEVFCWYKEQIASGNIQGASSILHVDAHSDLATGIDGAFLYIMETMMRKPINLRPDVSDATDWSKLNPGNYLVFMAACEWISDLTFVKHHKSNEKYNPLYFSGNDADSGNIQIKSYQPGILKNLASGTRLFAEIHNHEPIIVGQEVPFQEISWCNYGTDEKFDFILLTQSPSFTPATADKLMDVIKQYMVL
ncbi:hypothetical protein FMM05_08610 [Flavobacterium zepuense]|uniref:Arginase family protein n=1 Tax=Flavobacterium zepuense TaxID=2593302 RepID=A0A552V4E4_9FLAO|nr:UPF0489 family protein [Flavobacterium zepuense]TRW25355.1 hypothetical protein FMM05_08610 [Flavobacterium zepuense]